MLQNLTKGKMVEWVVLLVALVALGLSIAAVAKPCKSDFADLCMRNKPKPGQLPMPGDPLVPCLKNNKKVKCGGLDGESSCFEAGDDCNCQAQGKAPIGTLVGADCRNNICASGLTCIGGQCENTRGHKLDEGNECKKSSNCKSNRCLENRCVEREEIHHRLRNKILGQGEACDPNLPRVHNEKCANGLVCSLINKDELGNPTCVSKETHHDTYHSNKLIGGDPGSKSPSLGNIGGGPGSTYDPTGSGNGFGGGGTPSPPSSPSPSPGGGGKKSSDLPLILGIIGGSVGLVIVLAIAYLIVTKRLKL